MLDKISVIVPCYNVEQYVSNTIESVLRQTYTNMEILLVDDGSTDHTFDILQAYAAKDQRIRVIHQENQGVSYARWSGIRQSTGDWIAFVDGDDTVAETMYDLLLHHAKTYDVDISHCGYQMVYPNGKTVLYYGTEKELYLKQDSGVRALLKADCIEPGLWNKLYRRELFEVFAHSSIWSMDIRINEDLLMNYILFSAARSSFFIDRPMYSYILRSGSASTAHNQSYKITDPLKVIERIKDDVKQDKELYAIAYERYLRVLIKNTLLKNWKEESEEAKGKLRSEFQTKEIRTCQSKKLLLMAAGAAFFTPVYQLIRNGYDLITRKDKKYAI